MKKYLEYKSEIQGLEDVLETVKTTEKIAASHIHFLKKEVKNLEMYIGYLERVINRLLLFYSTRNHPFLSQENSGQKTLVVITGSKGLVGDLHHSLLNLLEIKSKEYQSFINIGAKGENYLKEENMTIAKSFLNVSEIPQPQEIADIVDYIFSGFREGRIKKIDILYSRFISLSQHEPIIAQFLPFEFNLSKENPKRRLPNEDNTGFPLFEPSNKEIFDKLLEKYIKVFFSKIILEAKLSEFSARTVATEHAVAKTEESIQKLAVEYLKERRKIMTQKQIESFIIHQTI